MRFLHAGPDHGGARPARTQRGRRPRPRSARNCPATSADAPATAGSSTRSSVSPSTAGGRSDDHRRPVPSVRRHVRRHDRDVADRVPTAPPRCRGASNSPPTCRPTGACGAPRCVRRTRTPGSVRSTVSGAWKIDGVEAVITADDVPGKLTYGLISQDQPVFAADVVRYVGEPIAAVAADHPETCRRALEAIVVEYEVLRTAARSRGGDRRSHARRFIPTAT